ncbi:MAG: MotA/TolQ/ExbB proton channel family protein [Hyphomicrobiales bacterium]|nr:MotA/TolQ/ExbB proton channel family protein [Hyphomicrobiales bacterium]
MFLDWFAQLGLMGWPLAVCSVLTLALGLERAVFWLRAVRQREPHYQEMAAWLSAHKSSPKPLRDEMINIMLEDVQRAYYSGLKGLRIIGTISPMLGLLGTVLGIIAAFRVIALEAGPVTPNMIADGLWEALLTTAVGLMIALPALLMAHFFRHLGEHYMDNLCQRLNRLSLSFELDEEAAAPRPLRWKRAL